MTKKRSMTARKPRTDALRNRERILEVAKAAFTRQGANASLEEIAKQAGLVDYDGTKRRNAIQATSVAPSDTAAVS